MGEQILLTTNSYASVVVGVLGVLSGSLVVHSVRARRQEAVETVGVARAEVFLSIVQLCWPHR